METSFSVAKDYPFNNTITSTRLIIPIFSESSIAPIVAGNIALIAGVLNYCNGLIWIPVGSASSLLYEYVLAGAVPAALPNGRRLTAGTGVTITDGGAGGPLTVAVTTPVTSGSGSDGFLAWLIVDVTLGGAGTYSTLGSGGGTRWSTTPTLANPFVSDPNTEFDVTTGIWTAPADGYYDINYRMVVTYNDSVTGNEFYDRLAITTTSGTFYTEGFSTMVTTGTAITVDRGLENVALLAGNTVSIEYKIAITNGSDTIVSETATNSPACYFSVAPRLKSFV